MKAALALLALAAPALAVQLSYDTVYDDASGSMDTVACSDGANGLETRFGFETFGDLPSFPHIGGAQAVDDWNSSACGSCFNLTYAPTGITVTVLAIDHADAGFNIALGAMNTLTNNQAVFLGRIDATAKQVDKSQCGL